MDYGVTLDGTGDLTGWAWGENIGWVSFSCRNTSSCGTVDYGVTVNTGTGALSGFAWAENVGWLGFSCANTASCGTVDYGTRISTPVEGSSIFDDGFEIGTTANWSHTVY